jgi:hypothetical protein
MPAADARIKGRLAQLGGMFRRELWCKPKIPVRRRLKDAYLI